MIRLCLFIAAMFCLFTGNLPMATFLLVLMILGILIANAG